MRLSRHIKAYIEAELRDYHQTKHELEGLKIDLINMSPRPPDGMPRGNSVSDPTADTVSSLLLDRRIARLETVVKGIESVLTDLDDDKLMLVKLKYWQRPRQLTNSGIAMEMYVDRKTIDRWNTAICYAIALELGEISKMSLKCP